MYQRLVDLAIPEVLTVAQDDPVATIQTRLSNSAAPLAVVVDDTGRRIAAVDERGQHPLVEAWSDTPVEAIRQNSDALHVLETGTPGILLLDDEGKPVSSVARPVILQALAATGPGAAILGDVLLPGLPPASIRAIVCRRCGFTNQLGVVVRGRTPCQNPTPPRHAIP